MSLELEAQCSYSTHAHLSVFSCPLHILVYFATDLEVLEENYHEYIKASHQHFLLHGFLFYLQAFAKSCYYFFQLEGRSLDIKCHMVQHDRQMVINRVTTMEEVKGNCVIS